MEGRKESLLEAGGWGAPAAISPDGRLPGATILSGNFTCLMPCYLRRKRAHGAISGKISADSL